MAEGVGFNPFHTAAVWRGGGGVRTSQHAEPYILARYRIKTARENVKLAGFCGSFGHFEAAVRMSTPLFQPCKDIVRPGRVIIRN